MNLATTLDLHCNLGGEKRSLFQIGDAVTYDRVGADAHLHGTYIGRVVDMRDDGQCQVRFSFPTGRSVVHQTLMVPIHKLRKAPINAIGEPDIYEPMSHYDPIPSFRPPSGRKRSKPVPTDEPQERDNRYLDVSKRKKDSINKFRQSIARRNNQPPNLGPAGTGAGGVVGVNHTTASGFGMFGSGTSEGAKKAWDTRGRGQKEFEKARHALPSGTNFDPLTHKTVSDLVYLAQHEIDLHEEGDNILPPGELKAFRRFVAKYGKSDE